MEVWIGVLVVLNFLQFGGLIMLGGAQLYLHGEVHDLCRQVDGLASADQIQAALVQHDALRRRGMKRPDLTIVNTQDGGTAFHGQTNVNAPMAGRDQRMDLPRPHEQETPP